jgi:hypothetical protein
MANRVRLTERLRKRFLDVLRETCNVSEAARCCGVSRRVAYNHREADPAFRKEWDEAVEETIDKLEREAWRRGVEGVDRPVTFQGEITATYKEYSDRMLELLLKAHRPEKYKERVENQHTGKDRAPLFPELTDEELVERLMAKCADRRDGGDRDGRRPH